MVPMGLVSVSLACGGMFCDAPPPPEPGFEVALPVEQTGETVVFGVQDGQTTMHVQVSYKGPADEFAWVLPVPAEPELLRSSSRLFDALRGATRPIYEVRRTELQCYPASAGSESDADSDADTDADTDADVDLDVPDGLEVIDRGEVGPYETITLTADDTVVLTVWLQENGFSVPDGLGPMLEPYLGETTHFVALKLAKDREVGDLEPVALRFAGETPSIPIQLTAVAVQDDMPIEVFVLGDHRAVPDNYLHMKLNPLNLDWREGVQDLLVNSAADEAGGQAFATEYSGTEAVSVAPLGGFELGGLAGQPDLASWLDALASNGFAWLTVQDLQRVVPMNPELSGVAPTAFYACPSCYPELLAATPFEASDATTTLYEAVLEPLEEADRMLRSASQITRLRSSISASEMTLDPRFVFAPSLPEVSRFHSLLLRRDCGAPTLRGRTPYEIDVDGLSFMGPSEDELVALGIDVLEWIGSISDDSALVIEQTSASGAIPLVDHLPELLERDIPEAQRNLGVTRECGCRAGAPGLGGWGALPVLALFGALRRRSGL